MLRSLPVDGVHYDSAVYSFQITNWVGIVTSILTYFVVVYKWVIWI